MTKRLIERQFKSTKKELSPELRERFAEGRRWASDHRSELEQRARERKVELQALGSVVKQLRQARLDRGLSLADVAARSGMDRSQLSRLENDPHPNPTLSTLSRLASAIGVELTIGIRNSAA